MSINIHSLISKKMHFIQKNQGFTCDVMLMSKSGSVAERSLSYSQQRQQQHAEFVSRRPVTQRSERQATSPEGTRL